MKRWILAAVAVPVVALALVTGVGALLPQEHSATVVRVVPGTPDEVWTVVTSVEAFPDWRPDVDEVRVEAWSEERRAWVESGGSGALPMEVVRWEPPGLLVTRIGEGLPFGGTWTYRIEGRGGGSRVTLTEDGEVYNPFFRFVSRFILGHEATMRRYLDALEGRMGGPPGGRV